MSSKRKIKFLWGLVIDLLMLGMALFFVILSILEIDLFLGELGVIIIALCIALASVIWIPIRLSLVLHRLSNLQLREDIALTHILPSNYLFLKLKNPVVRSISVAIIPLMLSCCSLLIRNLRHSDGEFILLIILLFFLSVISWAICFSGVFRILRHQCRIKAIGTKKTKFGLIWISIWSILSSFLGSYGYTLVVATYFLDDLNIEMKVGGLLISIIPLTVFCILFLWRDWNKLCSVYFKFEDEDFQKVNRGWF